MGSDFCTCTSRDCPCHPSNHNQGCTPCIRKNLQEGETPSCFFVAVSGHDKQGSYHYEDFAKEVLGHQ